MKVLPPLARISLGLVVLTMSLLLTGDFIFENSINRAQPVLDARKRMSESLAVQFSSLVAKNDLGTVQSTLFAIVRRDPEVLSAALRSEDGKIYTDAGVHKRYWDDIASDRSTATQAQVPLFKGDQRWGSVEIRFRPLPSSITGFFSSPFAKLVMFVSLAGFLGYLFFMKKTLRHLDPSAVIPARVKTALDALTEGVVLIDEKANIVLVNSTFSAKVGAPEKSLMGCSLASLPWVSSETRQPVRELPWTASVTEGKNRIGKALTFDPPDQDPIAFIVNSSPIVDDSGQAKGALATFDDVTELESKNARLKALVQELGASQDEVKRQNEKLHLLATRDPLTNCLNRRSFFEFFQKEMLAAQENGSSLSWHHGRHRLLQEGQRLVRSFDWGPGDSEGRRPAALGRAVHGPHLALWWRGILRGVAGHQLRRRDENLRSHPHHDRIRR